MTKELSYLEQQVSNIRKSWKVLLTGFFFTIGFSVLLMQINWSNVPVLGILFQYIQNAVQASGKFLRLMIIAVLGIVIFQWLRGLVTGRSRIGPKAAYGSSYWKEQIMETASFIAIVFILLWLIIQAPTIMPELFAPSESVFSIIGGVA